LIRKPGRPEPAARTTATFARYEFDGLVPHYMYIYMYIHTQNHMCIHN